jgi:hypothetical protein
MLSVPSEIIRRVHNQYPTIVIRWSNRKNRFEILEKYNRGAITAERHLWDYENLDGSPVPLVGDRLMNWLHCADTRKWPLEERMKLYDKEWDEAKAAKEREFSEGLRSIIVDDYNYIADIPTFFMNPAIHHRAKAHPALSGGNA